MSGIGHLSRRHPVRGHNQERTQERKPARKGYLLTFESFSDRDVKLIRSLISYGSLVAAAQDNGLSERHARRLIRSAIHRTGVKNRYALVAWLVLEGRISRSDVVQDSQSRQRNRGAR